MATSSRTTSIDPIRTSAHTTLLVASLLDSHTKTPFHFTRPILSNPIQSKPFQLTRLFMNWRHVFLSILKITIVVIHAIFKIVDHVHPRAAPILHFTLPHAFKASFFVELDEMLPAD